MDEKEYRLNLIERDAASIDKRVERWKRLAPASYQGRLPDLLWEYVGEVVDSYIGGHFIGVVLMCASILELMLADQLKIRLKLTQEEVERFRLEQTEILSSKLNILDKDEILQAKGLRRLRNYLIHANAGKLNKMAKKKYKDWGLGAYGPDAGLFLSPPWEGGLDEEALKYLSFTRDLTVRFYGAEEVPNGRV